VDIDLRLFGGSALTADIDVPKGRSAADMARDIPVTYVPARNTIFLSLALAWAETLAASDIVIGVNAVDFSGYPDCRPEYIAAFQRMADLATKAGVRGRQRLRIHTPLVHMTKSEIIRTGLTLGVDCGLTVSCYDPAPEGACGPCDLPPSPQRLRGGRPPRPRPLPDLRWGASKGRWHRPHEPT
jgi:7-cyano-7-deazaguanine synthase